MGRVVLLCSLVALLGLNGFAGSSQFLYANNATFGAPYVYQIDAKTGNVVNTFTNLQGSNTRGVVDVRNIMYTAAGDRYGVSMTSPPKLRSEWLSNVVGASGLASITFDGTNFWVGDYSGSNKAFLYSPTGLLR